MNTFESIDGTIFQYYSDLCGKVTIITPDKDKIEVDAKSILHFVASCYVLRKRMVELEQMTWQELLS